MFLKDIEELTADDIKTLVETLKFSENEKIEYKRTLPSKGSVSDPWLDKKDKIGNKAIEKLTAEIIAFANSNGGRLYLGIAENNETPAKPESIMPLPRVNQLSHKLEQIISDCIEPPLRNLKFKAIETNRKSGVIVIDVPRSERSPHRSLKNNECYQRVSHQCKKMKMDEIQHLCVKQPREQIEGLWLCYFGNFDQYVDSGITVLSNGRVYGGDGQFHYSGMYEIVNGNILNSLLKIEHHHGDNYTTFGTREKVFDVHFIATVTDNKIVGQIKKLSYPEHTVQVMLQKKHNLI